jgi:adenylate cyclase
MSEYFDALVTVIIDEGGTVDKYVGDAIFSYWNAPLPMPRHEYAACLTALKCHQASQKLNERWRAAGKPAWVTRFGLHAGDTVVGNVGSSERVDYTVIGTTVNIASRLEGLNKFYGTNVLASGEIVRACAGDFLFRHLDRSLPKGAVFPFDIYEVMGTIGGSEFRATPEMRKLVDDWNEAYQVYQSRDWLNALNAMEDFSERYPDDEAARIYIERIIEFILEPPPADWDGIMRFEKK